ncbi:MAG: GNAT family N-acetyltransferase [Actinobacteria bacterium]|nr:GNAT family N-acetyltransferase [Actinomycetota bacterium]
MLVKILEMNSSTARGVSALVKRVFPFEGHISSWIYTTPEGSLFRKIGLGAVGIRKVTVVWAALDDRGNVVGTIGLFRHRFDADEAFWLTYFCVAPEARGAGVGSRLLDRAIERARQDGADYLRLYTSDASDEADAQRLYESRGLHVYKTMNLIFYNILFREKSLGDSERVA